MIVVVPPVASLISATAWVRIFAHRKGESLQTTLQTAFTISSYIVTAGKDRDFYVPSQLLYFTLTIMRHRRFDAYSHRLLGPQNSPER